MVRYQRTLRARLLCACNAGKDAFDQQIPLVPVEYAASVRGAVPWRAPLHVQDSRLQLAEFDEAGQRQMRSYAEAVFPTDVLIVYSEAAQSVVVFLRRSPHGGCLLTWDAEQSLIVDPCFGSKFDLAGAYKSGPAQRSLDRLPASIREGMVWVGSQVIYGEPHP